MAEKDEEIESARKNLQRQLESLQSSLEEEVRAKNNLNRQRKAVEDLLGEMEANLSNKEKEVQDHAKNIKKLQAQLKVRLSSPDSFLTSSHDRTHHAKYNGLTTLSLATLFSPLCLLPLSPPSVSSLCLLPLFPPSVSSLCFLPLSPPSVSSLCLLPLSPPSVSSLIRSSLPSWRQKHSSVMS